MDDIASGVEPRAAIVDALRTIRSHPSVVQAAVTACDERSGAATITADIDARLPSRSYGAGISPTGVKRNEMVAIRFDASFPYTAPRFFLRADFPRNLPHIQPGEPGGPVEPCIYFGDRGDLMHRRGFGALFDHLAVWIERAACNELTNTAQGWEPIRRDFCDHVVEFDWSALAGMMTPDADLALLRSGLIPLSTAEDPSYLALVFSRSVGVEALHDWINPGTESETIYTVAIMAWSNGPPRNDAVFANEYAPDTVTTLGQLLTLAETYGCRGPLRDALTRLEQGYARGRKGSLPIIAILCARRPLKVIGTHSSLELIPYLIEGVMPSLLGNQTETKVSPMSHRHKLNRELLAAMSGMPHGMLRREVVQLGCGSLGSKLAIHLARAGVSPTRLVDNKLMSPHNAARHALLPGPEMRHPGWRGGKARVLAHVVTSFGSEARAIPRNVLTLVTGSPEYADVFSQAEIVVNSTGSAAVRSYLANATFDARVVESCLLARGRFGLMTAEGPDRNPSTGDLAWEAFQMMAERSDLSDALSPEEEAAVAPVGLGCASLTMVMSDSLLSLHAASMGQRLLRIVREGMPPAGEVLIGRLGDDGISLAWMMASVPPFEVVRPENAPGWSVRISGRVHRKIQEDVARHPGVETGGMAIGRVSIVDRTIWVTDMLEAPHDSARSAGEFRLGVDGLAAKIDDVRQRSGGALDCVGTWHRHLADQGGSPRDYLTARELGHSSLTPLVLVISRPSGYSAVLADDNVGDPS
jgi:hypothetical protein